MNKENFRLTVKNQILEYMNKNAMGFRNAKPRKDICDALVLEDRYFREIAVELKKEGHIATNSIDGYYSIPLVCTDPEEIEALKHSIADKYSRAYRLLDEARAMEARLGEKINKQMTMAV